MTLILLTCIVLAVLMITSWKRHHDFICPSFLYGVFWIVSLLAVPTLQIIDDISVTTALVFTAGAILFRFGFDFAYRITASKADSIMRLSWSVWILACILSVVFVYSIHEFVTNGIGESFYAMLKDETDEDLTLGDYFKRIIECVALGVLVAYWKIRDGKTRKKERIAVVSIAIMGLICAISTPSRNAMLQFFMPLIVIYLVTHKLPIKRQLAYLFIALAAFMGYYYYISTNKYSYIYDKSDSASEVLLSEIGTYLSGSIVAFDLKSADNCYTRDGLNTFRFVYALEDRIDGTHKAVKLTNDFYEKKELRTNVFTFYDFYSRDYGYLYAIFMQFVVGCLHGIAYKRRHSAIGLFFLAMLSYSLVMQFFQDQYLSLLSTWLQTIIIALVIFKTRLIIHTKRNG